MITITRETPEKGHNQEMRMAAHEKKAAEPQKNIAEILEEIASEFCESYCKYTYTWNEEKEGCELWSSEICANCPINKLV